MKDTLVIECVGLPGSGKSTSCRFFKQALESEGKKVALSNEIHDYRKRLSLSTKVLWGIKLLFKDIGKLLTYYYFLLRYGFIQRRNITEYPKYLFHHKVLASYIHKKKPDLVLLDQWSIQIIWSATLFSNKNSRNLLKFAHKLFLDVDLLIYFSLVEEKAALRIGKRNETSRFDKMNYDTRINNLMTYSELLKDLFESAKCSNKVTLFGDAKLEDNFLRLKEIYGHSTNHKP
ncbi:MAG: hypothetical protein KF862_24765 [Chitinophagaceae bacterium]|nr:hypothetical protein [Chitinophagaceae bacterium]